MYPSRFCVVVEGVPGPGQVLLYHTLTEAEAVLPASAIPFGEGSGLTPEDEAALAGEGFLVETGGDDDARLEAHFAACQDFRRAEAIILLTFDCNFACTYCYEAPAGASGTMDAATADAVAGFLLAQVRSRSIGHLEVVLFGGEPLLNRQTLVRLANTLRDGLTAAGTTVAFELITNGYLLDAPLVEELLAAGLKQVKVTLDGDRRDHDAARPLRGGGGTFERIYGNLLALADRVTFAVGGNYPPGGSHRFLRLVERMALDGLAGRLGQLGFRPIMEAFDPTRCGEGGGGCARFSDGNLEEFVALQRAVSGAGFEVPDWRQMGPCAGNRRNTWTIDPTGRLYPCPGFVGHPELAMGDALTGRLEEPPWRGETWRACTHCPHVPGCAGGCRAGAKNSGLAVDAVFCDRPFLDRVTREVWTWGPAPRA